ncbi:MAG TPA: hypothetical protein ENK52_06010 [Saprospiraceae bacterium]|nr:hypothetical protein [Saprospiraceae bacterium]
MKLPKVLILAFFGMMLFSFTACNKDAKPGNVTIYLDHNVAGKALVFDEMNYTSKAGHPFQVSRLRYYISNVKLHQADGTTFEMEGVHYRNAKEEDTRTLILKDIPAGDYNKITFTYGLDENTNVDGGLENTQTNIGMEWPIPGDHGYHYMKFEGKYDSNGSGTIKNFNLHTGATKGNQNYINMSLDLPTVKIDDNNWDIHLDMDLNQWLENPNTWDFDEFGPMIMMNQTAQEVLKANGATVFKIGNVEKK